MQRNLMIVASLVIFIMAISSINAATVSMKISGPGAVNDSTIKAGENVMIDIYWENEKERRGFTAGFKLTSKDIKKVIHVTDSAGGLNENGDIKGYNGWEDNSIWDFGGVRIANTDWDGELPDVLGFGGFVMKKRYTAHEKHKTMSMELIIPTEGTIVVDSSFWPPAGFWKFGSDEKMVWEGPYEFKVVK